jgi:hypothetical protein
LVLVVPAWLAEQLKAMMEQTQYSQLSHPFMVEVVVQAASKDVMAVQAEEVHILNQLVVRGLLVKETTEVVHIR